MKLLLLLLLLLKYLSIVMQLLGAGGSFNNIAFTHDPTSGKIYSNLETLASMTVELFKLIALKYYYHLIHIILPFYILVSL
jgi:hypothetical protein